MLEQFLSHLVEKKLANSGDKVLLAISGGLDSIVMLDLFFKAGFACEVAHVNFQLRGVESDGDEFFVKKLCNKYGFIFHSKKVWTKDLADKAGISIQMAARDLRYQWFGTLVQQYKFDVVATAHHLNDSIETALLNWTSGTSLAGLTGIPVKNGFVIRPLLFSTREDIQEYASVNSLIWREDSSNHHDDYKRNFIRHQIIPLFKQLNPSLEKTYKRQQRKLQGELSFLENAFESWCTRFVSKKNDFLIIDKKAFESVQHAGILLQKVIGKYGFNFDVSEEVIRALYLQSGAKFLSSTHSLFIDREVLILSPILSTFNDVHIQVGQEQVFAGKSKLKIEPSCKLQYQDDPLVAVLDASQVHFPLVWRTWRPGDSFYPLGMKQRKKLSDFLIDAKVSLPEKERVTVLESNGEIIWIVGYRIDNRFKLTSKTKEAIAFTFFPDFD